MITASEMTYTVSSGALNTTPTNRWGWSDVLCVTRPGVLDFVLKLASCFADCGGRRLLRGRETRSLGLPVRQRVVFKIAGLVHQSLVGLAPAYLADDCRLLSDVGRRPLRSNSNDIRKLLVPRTHNKLGDRSFSAADPRLWNDLPPGLRRPGLTFDSFRQSLKTHLFGDRSA